MLDPLIGPADVPTNDDGDAYPYDEVINVNGDVEIGPSFLDDPDWESRDEVPRT